MPDLPSGTVTFLFTDIEGSTALWDHDRAAMAQALAQHLALLRAAVEAHDGVLFKVVGDGAQAAFSTAPDAVVAAVEAQRMVLAHDWGPVGSLRVRMALHAGEAEPQDGDYLTAPLNRLARLLVSGHGGQILVSHAVRQLARGALPVDVELRDLGEHRLRDLLEPERVWQVLAPRLPTDYPPLKTLGSRPNNLPRQPTPFLGREHLVADLTALLRREDVQLVTLTGPGGTGKTRLALQVAAELLDAFSDGVYFVDLAALTDPALVASAIAGVVGVRSDGAGAALEALAAFLRDRRVLLLLDNFEHLVAGAPVVGELLRLSPELTVLATSRAPLHLRAEREMPVPPLALPDPARYEPLERLTQYEAVRLFIDRAIAAKPDFTVSNENAAALAEVCVRLDGLPLAIELAAARVRLLPLHALLRRLEQRLPLLTGGARDAPQRQRTLRDAIAWSNDLLSADEQTLFRRLGVFAGGCTLEAAEAVANPAGMLDVFTGLVSLIDEALLRQEGRAGDEPRFRMLETIREFALERLAASGEDGAVRGRLATWFLEQAEEIAATFETGYPLKVIERLEADYPNFTASLEWLERTGKGVELLRLAGAVGEFWYLTGRFLEGRVWLEKALAAAPEVQDIARVRALDMAGYLAHLLGDDDAAAARLNESAVMARQLNLPRHEASARVRLGLVAEDRGEYDESETHFVAARELFRQLGDEIGIGIIATTYHLGVVAYGRGETARAKQLWEEALAAAQARDETMVAGWCLEYLGLLATEDGELCLAANTFRRLLALGETIARRHQLGSLLNKLAVLGSACGMPEVAARLQGAASVLEGHGGRHELPERLAYDRAESQARAALGEEGYSRAWAVGGSFRPEDVSAAVETILTTAAARDRVKCIYRET